MTPSLLHDLDLGMIVLWFGIIANIPDGYLLCDGANGTPDLRDRFVVGAGTTYNPNDTGGNVTHGHTINANQHFHNVPLGTGITTTSPNRDDFALGEVITGTADPESSLPPYHSLVYIQRVA